MRFPFRVAVRASAQLMRLNAAIHMIAAFAFLASGLSVAVIVLVLAFLTLSWRRGLRTEQAKGLMTLTLEDDGSIVIEQIGGERRGTLCGTSADFGWAIWLHWVAGRRGRGAFILLRDNVSSDAWRGLRIWMRHKAHCSVSEEG